MQKIFNMFFLLCSAVLCASCATQAPPHSRLDYKNEVTPSKTSCITPAHPYAVVGPASGLPPIGQVPVVIGKPLPITKVEYNHV